MLFFTTKFQWHRKTDKQIDGQTDRQIQTNKLENGHKQQTNKREGIRKGREGREKRESKIKVRKERKKRESKIEEHKEKKVSMYKKKK